VVAINISPTLLLSGLSTPLPLLLPPPFALSPPEILKPGTN
jgi:hypothetical protein